MTITPNNKAVANAVSIKNVQFVPAPQVLPRKIVVIGWYDPAKTTVADNVPKQIFSADDGGAQFGFGSMIHRLLVQSFLGGQGVETWAVPQPEAGTPVNATGSATFTATGAKAGTIYMYVAGIPIPFSIAEGDTNADVATKALAALDAYLGLPTTQSITTPGQVDYEAVSAGAWGNDISITFNERQGEEFPVGISVVVVDMASGSGTYAIQDALDALGTGDDQNEDFFTDVIHGYGQETTTLDALSNYNGTGNNKNGNYADTVGRPFRSLNGDVATGTAALTALLALSDGRRELDRTNGSIGVPGSPNHPEEIAAQATGHMARINNLRAQDSYESTVLIGIIPGARDERWTSDYDNRDNAVRNGVTPTKVVSSTVQLQNVVTYYHPESVPEENNGFLSQRNISITQNILNAKKVNYGQEKWQQISIVGNVSRVTNTLSRQKARDINTVLDDEIALALAFEALAWIYSAAHTIEQFQLKTEYARVEERANGSGFDIQAPYIYSGEGGILNNNVFFDVSLRTFR